MNAFMAEGNVFYVSHAAFFTVSILFSMKLAVEDFEI
jgi:hypothetical protein